MSKTSHLKVLASFGQLERDKSYRISTKIISHDTRLFVRKQAYDTNAELHIKKMRANYDTIHAALSNVDKFRVAKILKSTSSYNDFEYANGTSLEQHLSNLIVDGKYSEVISVFNDIFNMIDTISSQKKSRRSSAVKIINDLYIKSDTTFISPGIVDLNVDNFITDEAGNYTLFDYEWVLDYPISSNYIKTRILYHFFLRKSDVFKYLPTDSKPFIRILVGNESLYVPSSIHKAFSALLTKESLKKYQKGEDVFQTIVSKHHHNLPPSTISHVVKEIVQSPQATLHESYELQKSQIIQLGEELVRTQYKLTSIQDSRVYKTASRISKVVRKIF